jgi:cytidylate kinase
MVGRGANFALHWVEHGLHVRIAGSPEARIQRLGKAWHVSSEIARRRMLEIDADRRAFIHNHFKKDVNDLSFYTLVVNTDHLSVEQAVGSIMALLNSE